MRYLISFLFIAVLVFACGDSDKPSAAQIEAGKKVFKQYCITCHGADGRLSLNGAKDFTTAQSTLEERILIITNGRNLMTPFKGVLNEQQIKEVAAYTMKLSKGEQ